MTSIRLEGCTEEMKLKEWIEKFRNKGAAIPIKFFIIPREVDFTRLLFLLCDDNKYQMKVCINEKAARNYCRGLRGKINRGH